MPSNNEMQRSKHGSSGTSPLISVLGGLSRAVSRSLLIAVVTVLACAKAQLVLYEPNDPRLLGKLGLTAPEWREIQDQFHSHPGLELPSDLRVLRWGRSSVTGFVEVWCEHTASASRPASGPVFFFRREDGHWYLLDEMSEWGRD